MGLDKAATLAFGVAEGVREEFFTCRHCGKQAKQNKRGPIKHVCKNCVYLPCSKEGCTKRATRESSSGSRAQGFRPFCTNHKGGELAKKPLSDCAFENCKNKATPSSSNRHRCAGTKPYCSEHRSGHRYDQLIMPCGFEGCKDNATRISANMSRYYGSKGYCEKHKGGRLRV
jgi:hypothetical protein